MYNHQSKYMIGDVLVDHRGEKGRVTGISIYPFGVMYIRDGIATSPVFEPQARLETEEPNISGIAYDYNRNIEALKVLDAIVNEGWNTFTRDAAMEILDKYSRYHRVTVTGEPVEFHKEESE